jgi:X-Pro dipeptidyl-peptidase
VNPYTAQGLKFIDGKDCIGEGTPEDDGCYRRAADNTITSDFQMISRGILDAQNYRSLNYSTPLTPGNAYQIAWKMLPQDYEFKAGHRLGLVLKGTNDDFNIGLNVGDPDAEPGTGAKVTVDLAGTSVSLPLVTGWSGGN